MITKPFESCSNIQNGTFKTVALCFYFGQNWSELVRTGVLCSVEAQCSWTNNIQ